MIRCLASSSSSSFAPPRRPVRRSSLHSLYNHNLLLFPLVVLLMLAVLFLLTYRWHIVRHSSYLLQTSQPSPLETDNDGHATEEEEEEEEGDWDDLFPTGTTIANAVEWANSKNRQHKVLNEDRYGKMVPISSGHHRRDFQKKEEEEKKAAGVEAVIVVQLHNRTEYHRRLVESLSKVVGIERVLLIFSHDYISPAVNRLVRGITFARVIQLFYPYSLQLLDQSGEATTTSSSRNDRSHHGHNNRRTLLAQIRQHWWWKTNYIFDAVLRDYGLAETNYLLFMEDDELAAPDLLHVLQLMIARKVELCPQCLMLKLGVHGRYLDLHAQQQYRDGLDKVYLLPNSATHRGMAIDLAAWNLYRGNCSMREFCTVRLDGNWDWGLHFAHRRCLQQLPDEGAPMSEMWLASPRVIHVGTCGMHARKKSNSTSCTSSAALVTEFLHLTTPAFFPRQLHAVAFSGRREVAKEIPGWNDTREHRLCLLNTHPTKLSTAAERLEIASQLLLDSVDAR